MPCPPTPTPATSDSYDGLGLNPDPNQSGTYSSGGFVSASGFPHIVYQNVGAPVRVILPAGSNPSLIKQGPQAYSVTLSLSGTNTIQLTPGMADSLQNPVSPVSPNVFSFVYRSRQIKVATVSDSGLITAQTRGECTVLVGAARSANLPFTNASPASGLTGCEVFAEVTVRVTA
jgi:hypothetical protein